ncbi:hypothetical protein QZH41_008216 [Actinostola sp. cb2023]|nr:hypothetical protein QZH41_008216 [Actinostola sp. cb2023]
MTSLLLRSIRSGTLRPCIRLLSSRTSPALISRGFANEKGIATPEEMATGLEKLEYDAVLAGDEDPFRLKMSSGPPGTREKPTEVPTAFGERIVGCVCEEDATVIKWMLVKKGDPHRCDCGHYFVVKEANPIGIIL